MMLLEATRRGYGASNSLYWYWYGAGQQARKTDMNRGTEKHRIKGHHDAPEGAPDFGSSEFYSFLDGYFLRHGFC
jgi:hypothetical protein